MLLILAGFFATGCEFSPISSDPNSKNPVSEQEQEENAALAKLIKSYIWECVYKHGHHIEEDIFYTVEKHLNCIMERVAAEPMLSGKASYFNANLQYDENQMELTHSKAYVRKSRGITDSIPKAGYIINDWEKWKSMGGEVDPQKLSKEEHKEINKLYKIAAGPLSAKVKEDPNL